MSYAYSPAQRAFHWTMAGVVLLALVLGVIAGQIESGVAPRPALLFVHKSLGMAALLMLPLRLVWRVAQGEPGWRVPLARLVRAAAHGAHALLYLGMAILPLSGYVMSGAGGHPLPFFGLFSFPFPFAQDKAMAKGAGAVHHWIGYAFLALVALHVAAALWHRVKGDETMARMAPRLAAERQPGC